MQIFWTLFLFINFSVSCIGRLDFQCNGSCLTKKSSDLSNSSDQNDLSKIDMYPDCTDPDKDLIVEGEKYSKCDGSIGVGTYKIVENTCEYDAQESCLTNANFPAVEVGAVDPINISVGTTIVGIAGSDDSKTRARASYCRNGISSGFYNTDLNPPPTGSSVIGTVHNWWDTVNDAAYPSAFSGVSAAWGTSYYCGGETFSDVTNSASWLVPSNTPLNCFATCTSASTRPFSKIIYESSTGLYLTNILSLSGGVGATWSEAVNGCSQLNSGDGVGKWRLPTQKELLLFAALGIYFRNVDLFASDMPLMLFWGATQANTANATNIQLDRGASSSFNRGGQSGVICIR